MRPLPVAVLLALVLTSPARAAGAYEHVSLPPGTDGWSPAVQHVGGWIAVGDAIGSGQGLRLVFSERATFLPGEGADWTYLAPPDTEIAGWHAERELAGLGAGDWNAVVWAVEDGRSRAVSPAVPARDRPWGPVGAGGLHASRLSVTLICGGPHLCLRAGPSAQLGLRAAVAELRDDLAPEVAPPRGDLAELRTLQGVARLSAVAADRGGGLARTVVEVDGVTVAETPVDGGAACRDLDPGPVRRYAARVPCALRASADAALDTRGLADGPHELRVVVEDAAGNRTTVLGPVTRVVDNVPPPPPPPPPPPAAAPAPAPPAVAPAPGSPSRLTAWLEHAGRRLTRVTVPYGTRVRVRGRIEPRAAGTPLTALEKVGGLPTRAVTGVRTRGDGTFLAFTPVGPSRRLHFAGDDGARSRWLTVRVRASALLRARRRGAALILAGALRGGRSVPNAGALVLLECRRRGAWAPLGLVRTDGRGRFRRRVAHAAACDRARATVPRQPGLPFARGSGPVVEVVE
jgi:hypothetical protein